MPEYTFCLGEFINDTHLESIQKIATWLDSNRFSTTLFIRDNFVFLTVEADPDWNSIEMKRLGVSTEDFKLYAAETIIKELFKEI